MRGCEQCTEIRSVREPEERDSIAAGVFKHGLQILDEYLHGGEILWLHTVGQARTAAVDRDEARERGQPRSSYQDQLHLRLGTAARDHVGETLA